MSQPSAAQTTGTNAAEMDTGTPLGTDTDIVMGAGTMSPSGYAGDYERECDAIEHAYW